MDGDVAQVKKVPTSPCEPKVHNAICCQLMKVSDKIISILPAIESARPGSSSGIQVLCTLNNTVEKAKLLVCYCAESSKLYLAFTAESITLRCQRILTDFNQSLHQIQTMVPPLLASKISEVLDHLRDVKFIVDPREDEAGKALLNLMTQTDSSEDQKFQVFQFVTSRLNITSSITLLVERRSIKKLLDKFQGVDKEEKILKYFLYLLKRYGKQKPDGMEYKENSYSQDNCYNVINSESDACKIYDTDLPRPNNVEVQSELPSSEMPPEEFCCPISSKLMYDPVVIASGKTYERIWIQKWFSEGYDTCPKTQKKLKNLSVIPNSCMKDLISNWCKKHGVIVPDPCTQSKEAAFDLSKSALSNSVSSLKNVSAALLDGTKRGCLNESELWKMSDMSSGDSCCSDSSPIKPIQSSNNNHDQLFSWSDDYQRYQSFSSFSRDMYLNFLFGLSELPTLLQEKVVEHLKNLIEGDEVTFCGMLSNGFAEALMLFLKKSHSLCDMSAQRCGAQIFLALMNNKRWELTSLNEDSFQVLSPFLNCGISDEVLMILQKLVQHPNFMSYIVASSIPLDLVHYLYSGENKYVEIIVKILSDLSFHGEMRYLFLSTKCIEKLGQLLSDEKLVKLCLNILHNLFDDEETSRVIADANGCITSIADVLESDNHEEQEQAVTILLALCSCSLRNCMLVLKEGVIPSLVHISLNGNAKAKENSMKLLHVLRDIRLSDRLDNSRPHVEPESDLVEHPTENSEKLLPKYKFFGFFRRKMRYLIQSLSLS